MNESDKENHLDGQKKSEKRVVPTCAQIVMNAPKKMCTQKKVEGGQSNELETRGRKEMELPDYRVHVKMLNDENDKKISSLQAKKNLRSTSRTEFTNLSLAIARIQREKTTRRRRLMDRERTFIQETIIQSVLRIV